MFDAFVAADAQVDGTDDGSGGIAVLEEIVDHKRHVIQIPSVVRKHHATTAGQGVELFFQDARYPGVADDQVVEPFMFRDLQKGMP